MLRDAAHWQGREDHGGDAASIRSEESRAGVLRLAQCWADYGGRRWFDEAARAGSGVARKKMKVQLPAGGWRPRPYQIPAWEYLEGGGKHCELVWHRRSGKDELSLHWTAVSMFRRVGNYWHMLPQANQARKALWD